MKKHPQEKYQHLKTQQYEFFTFIGDHKYQRADGVEFYVMDLRRQYRFISTYKEAPPKPKPHVKWEHNPANGFSVRKSYK